MNQNQFHHCTRRALRRFDQAEMWPKASFPDAPTDTDALPLVNQKKDSTLQYSLAIGLPGHRLPLLCHPCLPRKSPSPQHCHSGDRPA